MKGIIFLPTTEISEEAKARIVLRRKKRDELLKSMVDDYQNCRFDEIIKKL